jgi:hypothetical protein
MFEKAIRASKLIAGISREVGISQQLRLSGGASQNAEDFLHSFCCVGPELILQEKSQGSPASFR